MSTTTIGSEATADPPKHYVDPELLPNIDSLVIEDDEPVDNLYQDAQRRLLVNGLYSSWSGPGLDRTWMCGTDIGVFLNDKEPPLVPDVLLSLDTEKDIDPTRKGSLSYFVWERGKVPDVVIEIVSNKVGGEDTRKLRAYQRMRVPYYAVYDPYKFIGPDTLRIFKLDGTHYVRHESGIMEDMNLGLRIWKGGFEQLEADWLRWTDASGKFLACGNEKSLAAWNQVEAERKKTAKETERADAERARAEAAGAAAVAASAAADAERKRADRLAEKLRELGIDPS